MKSIDPNLIRQIFVLLLILAMGWLIGMELVPYLSGILGTITLYVLLYRPMKLLLARGWGPNLAAVTLMVVSFITILLPLATALYMLGNKLGSVAKNSKKVVSALKSQLQQWEYQLGIKMDPNMEENAIPDWLSKNLEGLAGGTFNTVISIAIMYFLVYYMLTNRSRLRDALFRYVPMSTKNLEVIRGEIWAIVKANAVGIPLVALAQGVVALVGFLIFDIESPFFWAVMVTIGSMVPFVGNFLGTIPVFIISLSNGQSFQAWGILIYGILVVGASDNLIRLYLLKRLDDVHPLITLIGVLVGIPLFGFIGLIFGPLLVNLFMVVLRIYSREYGTKRDGRL